MAFLTIKPEENKWYISAGFILLRGPSSEEENNKMIEHNLGREKMILDGPFPSKSEAITQLKSGKYEEMHEPYVWECTSDADQVQ